MLNAARIKFDGAELEALNRAFWDLLASLSSKSVEQRKEQSLVNTALIKGCVWLFVGPHQLAKWNGTQT